MANGMRMRIVYLLVASLWGVLASSCGTLEVGFERTPTEDGSVIATLSYLMFEGTRNAAIATGKKASEVAYNEQVRNQYNTPTPDPRLGTVNGNICYPGEGIPAMTIYFREITTNQITEIPVVDNQVNYSIQLTPGEYYAFAWMPGYQVGGMYTKAVPCGLAITCTDHDPIAFKLRSGETVAGIDICDWVISLDKLPVPSGYQLPTGKSTVEPTPTR